MSHNGSVGRFRTGEEIEGPAQMGQLPLDHDPVLDGYARQLVAEAALAGKGVRVDYKPAALSL